MDSRSTQQAKFDVGMTLLKVLSTVVAVGDESESKIRSIDGKWFLIIYELQWWLIWLMIRLGWNVDVIEVEMFDNLVEIFNDELKSRTFCGHVLKILDLFYFLINCYCASRQ